MKIYVYIYAIFSDDMKLEELSFMLLKKNQNPEEHYTRKTGKTTG